MYMMDEFVIVYRVFNRINNMFKLYNNNYTTIRRGYQCGNVDTP